MIKLSEVLSIKNLKDYKIHLAVYNGHDEPLDVFAQDKNKWDHWNAWRGKRNCFNRKYIISFMGSSIKTPISIPVKIARTYTE